MARRRTWGKISFTRALFVHELHTFCSFSALTVNHWSILSYLSRFIITGTLKDICFCLKKRFSLAQVSCSSVVSGHCGQWTAAPLDLDVVFFLHRRARHLPLGIVTRCNRRHIVSLTYVLFGWIEACGYFCSLLRLFPRLLDPHCPVCVPKRSSVFRLAAEALTHRKKSTTKSLRALAVLFLSDFFYDFINHLN